MTLDIIKDRATSILSKMAPPLYKPTEAKVREWFGDLFKIYRMAPQRMLDSHERYSQVHGALIEISIFNGSNVLPLIQDLYQKAVNNNSQDLIDEANWMLAQASSNSQKELTRTCSHESLTRTPSQEIPLPLANSL